MTYQIDTNVFLRFIVEDDKKKAEKVKRFFEKAEKDGGIKIVAEPYVLVELAHVLSSYFKLPKSEVCEKIKSVLFMPFIEIPGRVKFAQGLEIYEKYGVDLVDALIYVSALDNNRKILSFDLDFDKMSPNLRLEP